MKKTITILMLVLTGLVKGQDVYLLDADEHTDTLSVEQMCRLHIKSKVRKHSELISVLKQKEFFYVKIDNTYHEYGIHNWRYRKLIIKDLKTECHDSQIR